MGPGVDGGILTEGEVKGPYAPRSSFLAPSHGSISFWRSSLNLPKRIGASSRPPPHEAIDEPPQKQKRPQKRR